MLAIGDIVFIRFGVHAQFNTILRGAQGIVMRIRTGYVVVQFSDGSVTYCQEAWLEPFPGTVCRAIVEIYNMHPNCRYNMFPYKYGMLVTDLAHPEYPRPDARRFLENLETVLRAGMGFTVMSGVDATAVQASIEHKYPGYLHIEDVGLIICESPRIRGSVVENCIFQANTVNHFLDRFTNVPCILVMRSHEVPALRMRVGENPRVEYHCSSRNEFNLHYAPLRDSPMSRTYAGIPVGLNVDWTAVVIYPHGCHYVRFNAPISIPDLVWRMMLCRRRSVQLACYTFESTLEIQRHVREQCRLHNIVL